MDEKKLSERLKILQGEDDLKTFSSKCGVDANTLKPYLEGKANVLPTMRTLVKVSERYNVKIGWLIGEDDDERELPPPYKGFGIENHVVIADKLYNISTTLNELYVEFSIAYPNDGDWGRACGHLRTAFEEVLKARSCAEENMYKEHRGIKDKNVYYGSAKNAVHEKKRAGNDS